MATATAAVLRSCADLRCESQGLTCQQQGDGDAVCISASPSSSTSEWSQWWLIPILICAVILLERAYSAGRRMYLARSGSVDSSHFSQLHTREADDFDEQLGDPLEMDTLHGADDSEDDLHTTQHTTINANSSSSSASSTAKPLAAATAK